MTPMIFAILLLVVGIALLIGELLLPTGGVLGVLSGIALIAAIVCFFMIDRWIGVGMLVAVVVASPFLFNWTIDLWQRTPVGRRLVLQSTLSTPVAPSVRIGQTGRTVSELRPMGECDFGDQRLEALSEHGWISPGQPVRIVALDQNRPVVRPLTETSSQPQ